MASLQPHKANCILSLVEDNRIVLEEVVAQNYQRESDHCVETQGTDLGVRDVGAKNVHLRSHGQRDAACSLESDIGVGLGVAVADS